MNKCLMCSKEVAKKNSICPVCINACSIAEILFNHENNKYSHIWCEDEFFYPCC